MKKQILKAIGGASLAILVLAVFAQAQNGNEQGLVGSWDVQITIRDCQTGTPFFSFPAMITYNQGGTMQESDLGSPGLVRLLGHGVWNHQNGRQYSAAFRFLNFNPDRTFAGTNVVRQAITLGPGTIGPGTITLGPGSDIRLITRGSNTYTSTDTSEVLDANGDVIPGAGGCATETAIRFK